MGVGGGGNFRGREGFRVWGLGFRVSGLGVFGFAGLGFGRDSHRIEAPAPALQQFVAALWVRWTWGFDRGRARICSPGQFRPRALLYRALMARNSRYVRLKAQIEGSCRVCVTLCTAQTTEAKALTPFKPRAPQQ